MCHVLPTAGVRAGAAGSGEAATPDPGSIELREFGMVKPGGESARWGGCVSPDLLGTRPAWMSSAKWLAESG